MIDLHLGQLFLGFFYLSSSPYSLILCEHWSLPSKFNYMAADLYFYLCIMLYFSLDFYLLFFHLSACCSFYIWYQGYFSYHLGGLMFLTSCLFENSDRSFFLIIYFNFIRMFPNPPLELKIFHFLFPSLYPFTFGTQLDLLTSWLASI